ncbi:NifU family protein [Antrihabitans cavernicola]|uniref:Rieske 2Fe-2S domain-containing protein n=1 Tax=Antrihabitans cavernicola TaxID=2495913 RepID=A0A5A7S7T8_9NOCA|nr:NifU family protein [Spelaeibacter cavernicola]KAA0022210.1 Rieske 2Fe-2S domain-containing protein [Spelaeibacter cavernicola]
MAPDDVRVDPDWRVAGERIETLLDASSAGGTVARERAEALVREVVDLYGAGLERIVALVDPRTLDALASDELVASLLLVNGLHPHDVSTRVRTALDSVRPYLGSHGGDVDLLDISPDGVVHLRLTGSCKTCPSSSVTLELAVKDAVLAAAPETTEIVVVADEPASSPNLISADSLLSRVHSAPLPAAAPMHGTWIGVPELADLMPGEVGGFAVGALPMLVCRIDDELFAYRDRCPSCTESLAGAVLARRAGGAVGDAVLRCPICGAHYDIRGAGRSLDDPTEHLDPLPVLIRDGVLSVAVPVTEVAG